MKNTCILHLLTLVFVASFATAYAQQPRTTGGNHLWAGINSITPCHIVSAICTLTNGQSYAVQIAASSDEDTEEAFAVIADSDYTHPIGKLENVKPSEAYSIPVNNLTLPAGPHRFSLAYRAYWNHPSSVEVYITNSVGAPGVEKKNEASIYPNPVTDKVTITDTKGVANIAISNLYGQVVYRRACKGEEIEVDVKALPAGIYNVRLQGGDGVVVKQFMKSE